MGGREVFACCATAARPPYTGALWASVRPAMPTERRAGGCHALPKLPRTETSTSMGMKFKTFRAASSRGSDPHRHDSVTGPVTIRAVSRAV